MRYLSLCIQQAAELGRDLHDIDFRTNSVIVQGKGDKEREVFLLLKLNYKQF